MSDRTNWIIATIGHGGIGAHGLSAQGHATRSSGATLDDTLARCPLVLDLRPIPWEDLCTLSVQGPMIDPKLPEDTHCGMFAKPERFDPTPREGRDARLGSTGSFSNVSWDVYARMAVAFGATIVKGAIPATPSCST